MAGYAVSNSKPNIKIKVAPGLQKPDNPMQYFKAVADPHRIGLSGSEKLDLNDKANTNLRYDTKRDPLYNTLLVAKVEEKKEGVDSVDPKDETLDHILDRLTQTSADQKTELKRRFEGARYATDLVQKSLEGIPLEYRPKNATKTLRNSKL